MEQKRLGDKFIGEIVEAIMASDKKDEITDCIAEFTEKCAGLCNVGENVRVLNEYRILIDRIIKKLNL